jgi:hypothetical protein
LRHALAFSTWHSLSTKGIGRPDAAKLITALVEGAAIPQRRSEKSPQSVENGSRRTLPHRPEESAARDREGLLAVRLAAQSRLS